jgi:hypothetical protein
MKNREEVETTLIAIRRLDDALIELRGAHDALWPLVMHGYGVYDSLDGDRVLDFQMVRPVLCQLKPFLIFECGLRQRSWAESTRPRGLKSWPEVEKAIAE